MRANKPREAGTIFSLIAAAVRRAAGHQAPEAARP